MYEIKELKMEIDNLNVKQAYYQPSREVVDKEQLVDKNPNIQQNLQVQVLKEAAQGPSSPTSQAVQLLANTQGASVLQAQAQQQIRNGYLDIKV